MSGETGTEGLQPFISAKKKDSKVGLTPKEKEIHGTWAALQYADRVAKDQRRSVDGRVIKELHRKMMEGTDPTMAGNYRVDDVTISEASFTPPFGFEVNIRMYDFQKELAERTANFGKSLNDLEQVVETVAWAHQELVGIHPFDDGNGRTARALADIVCKRAGLHYIDSWGEDREKYLDAVDASQRTGSINPFKAFVAGRLQRGYDDIANEVAKGSGGLPYGKSAPYTDLIDRRNEFARIAATAAAAPVSVAK